MPQTKFSKEEIARRGEELYEKILAIDISSGDFEIDDTTLPAADRLRHSDAEIYILRIGYDAVYSFHGLPPRRTKQ